MANRAAGADQAAQPPALRGTRVQYRMNTLKVTLTSPKELKDEKGRGLEEGKHDIWARTTLDSTGQSTETEVVEKCSTAWTGTEFNKKMSLCVDSV